jgi:hypothetical protein
VRGVDSRVTPGVSAWRRGQHSLPRAYPRRLPCGRPPCGRLPLPNPARANERATMCGKKWEGKKREIRGGQENGWYPFFFFSPLVAPICWAGPRQPPATASRAFRVGTTRASSPERARTGAAGEPGNARGSRRKNRFIKMARAWNFLASETSFRASGGKKARTAPRARFAFPSFLVLAAVRRRIFSRSSSRPRTKSSFANDQRACSTLRKPCTRGDGRKEKGVKEFRHR